MTFWSVVALSSPKSPSWFTTMVDYYLKRSEVPKRSTQVLIGCTFKLGI